MKKKLTYKYETQSMNEVTLGKKKSIKKIEEFFLANMELEEDEMFFVVKAFIDADNKVQTIGAYYGMEMSPFTFLAGSSDDREEVFLAEATSKKAMFEFIQNNNKDEKNIYAFKIRYEDFKIASIESLYGGPFELDFYIFNLKEDDDSDYGKVLKRLGEMHYTPRLKLFNLEDYYDHE